MASQNTKREPEREALAAILHVAQRVRNGSIELGHGEVLLDFAAVMAEEWSCGRIGRSWSDDIRPYPVCGSRGVRSVRFPGRQIANMEHTETGINITFEDGSTAILGALPQEVQ